MQKKIQRWLLPLAAALVIVFSLGFLLGQGRAALDEPLVRTQKPGTAYTPVQQSAAAPEKDEGTAAPAPSNPDAPAAKIDLNSATAEELQTLPGIGETIAQRILVYRRISGGFLTVEQIMEVNGIGEAKFAQIKDLITVEGMP